MQLQYHVRFYGDENERGWVPESAVIQFRGRKAFDDYAERMVLEHRRDRKSFSVSSGRKRAWDVAVDEAETARGLPRLERIEAWMPIGDLPVPADSGLEPGTADDLISGGRCRPSPRGRKTKVAVEKLEVSIPPRADRGSLPKSMSDQRNAQFAVFCQKRRLSLRGENPSMSDVEIESVLADQWRRLDAKTRARYIPMGSDVIRLSDVMVSPTVKSTSDGLFLCR